MLCRASRTHYIGLFLRNVVPKILRQHWTGISPVQCCLEYLGQHYTRFLPVLCWPMSNRQFYEENNLYSFVSTMLRQYSIGILSSQCCPNTSETILHKKITCSKLPESAHTGFCRKITYAMFSWSACVKIAQESYLCNVDPQPMNNFTQVNIIQCFLYLFGPTLCKGNYLCNVGPWSTDNFS